MNPGEPRSPAANLLAHERTSIVMSTQTASDPAAVDRNWILSEFSKGIDAEGQMAHEAQAQADAPPEPALGVLYAQIAEADLRHHDAVETIAVRYGLTPGQGHHGFASNIGETLGRLKDKVTGAASNSLERLGHHLRRQVERAPLVRGLGQRLRGHRGHGERARAGLHPHRGKSASRRLAGRPQPHGRARRARRGQVNRETWGRKAPRRGPPSAPAQKLSNISGFGSGAEPEG